MNVLNWRAVRALAIYLAIFGLVAYWFGSHAGQAKAASMARMESPRLLSVCIIAVDKTHPAPIGGLPNQQFFVRWTPSKTAWYSVVSSFDPTSGKMCPQVVVPAGATTACVVIKEPWYANGSCARLYDSTGGKLGGFGLTISRRATAQTETPVPASNYLSVRAWVDWQPNCVYPGTKQPFSFGVQNTSSQTIRVVIFLPGGSYYGKIAFASPSLRGTAPYGLFWWADLLPNQTKHFRITIVMPSWISETTYGTPDYAYPINITVPGETGNQVIVPHSKYCGQGDVGQK